MCDDARKPWNTSESIRHARDGWRIRFEHRLFQAQSPLQQHAGTRGNPAAARLRERGNGWKDARRTPSRCTDLKQKAGLFLGASRANNAASRQCSLCRALARSSLNEGTGA
ncbi:hypothetical protein [Paraburkholderia unamae]|uniref:hypothetical protein n=1 Tax=Paraburkholderia unamae TaxID=219649 RepID=UPI0011BED9BA|nr:hypothetical protein [Paraburkholderia unamae]